MIEPQTSQPAVLLDHYLKQLRLPTMLRELSLIHI